MRNENAPNADRSHSESTTNMQSVAASEQDADSGTGEYHGLRTEDIGPCPFCGGPAQLYGSSPNHHVECIDCSTRSGPYRDPENAIEFWNNPDASGPILKSCPVCGDSEPYLVRHPDGTFWVECFRCHTKGTEQTSPDNAELNWNDATVYLRVERR